MSKAEKAAACMENKARMFDSFHVELPDAHFVVMSGLLLPGRSRCTSLTCQINSELEAYCEFHEEYMTFVDAEAMTYDGSTYRSELFIADGIRLNRDGQRLWCRDYIAPQIEMLIEQMDTNNLLKYNHVGSIL